jgi:hypothetical protein
MTLRVLVFAEDILGMTLARDLCDRVVVERCAAWPADVWSDPALRDSQRVWTGDGHEPLRDEMLAGLARARVDLPVVLATAHQESEAWVIAGFVATDAAEQATLRRLRSEHGFDPASEPHRLTSGRRQQPHDAKRAHDELIPEGELSERAQRCWLDTPLDELERRAAHTGLPEYLADVARLVLPLLCGPGRPR